MKRLLVVGGTGFIGQHLCREAARRGYEVTSLSLSDFSWSAEEHVSHVVGNILDRDSLKQILQDRLYEYVVNCGGYVDHADYFDHGQEIYNQHFTGVMNLVEAVNRTVLKRFVQIGSSDEYGMTPGPNSEADTLGIPISPYGAAKLAASQFLQMVSERNAFPALVIRPFLVYGPGQSKERFLPMLISGLLRGETIELSSGRQLRDFCHVSDFVHGVLRALETPGINGRVINLASGSPVSIRFVAEQVLKLVGRGNISFGTTLPIGENLKLVADVALAGNLLDWRPSIDLNDGLRSLIAQIAESQKREATKDGTRERARLLRVSASSIGETERQAVAGVLRRGFLGMGEEVRQFELGLTEFFGRPAVCVVNGTAALQLALQGAGIGLGDEVLVPSLTYVASFQAISALGAKPVSCDVNSETLTLDWRDAESRLTSRTRAVMPVHFAGGVGDLFGVYAFASKYGLRVIEDAAHAFGTTAQGKRVGSFGDVACFSFDGIKNITSGEGGCLVTDDESVLKLARDARLLGVTGDTEMRFSGHRSWTFDVKAQGWRYHMSNLMAAIGIEQLRKREQFAVARQALARQYDELLADHYAIFPLETNYSEVVPHIYPVRIRGLKNRDSLRERLLAENIQTGVHYFPNHRLTLYREVLAAPLPRTDTAYAELLTLPLHPNLFPEDVAFVCEILKREVACVLSA
jgi:dTDP-4-amino-4,6-dideoxygalactose transaminase/nucleoside-diphosphate-sugar epimerase